jgi:hypothetical protein
MRSFDDIVTPSMSSDVMRAACLVRPSINL